jgi:hypothetical protein
MLDADKQAAINLFVRLDTAFWLRSDIQLGVEPTPPVYQVDRPHYRQWFTPSHLEHPPIDDLAPINHVFREYYKPHILSQFGRLYALWVTIMILLTIVQ